MSFKATQNEFSWSKSRDNLFRECLRAYYYNHYGAWGGWRPEAEEAHRELYVMKSLSNRPMWRGIAVHDTAERAMLALLDGRPWPLERAIEETERRLREELEISSQGRYRGGAWITWGANRIKVNGLQEHYYEVPVSEDEWGADVALVAQCVRNLYESKTYRRLLELDAASILSVEKLESFLVGDVKVWVKLDLCVKGKDGRIVIVDWKTGSSHRQADLQLQLGIYGLFGSRFWDVPPERILGYDVNLKSCSSQRHPIDEAVLAHVTSYVGESAKQMRACLTDVESNIAEIGRFPMTEDLWRCRRCRFRRACEREDGEQAR